jgi:uncharacterized protein
MAEKRDEILDEYVELVQFLASSLLEDDVEIEVRGHGDRDPLRIDLHVPEEHRGRVIGRGGRIARAMRTLIDNSGIAYHDPVVLDIVD